MLSHFNMKYQVVVVVAALTHSLSLSLSHIQLQHFLLVNNNYFFKTKNKKKTHTQLVAAKPIREGERASLRMLYGEREREEKKISLCSPVSITF